MSQVQVLGPLVADIAGLTLSAREKERLKCDEIGGVILFSRNYQNPEQLTALITEIKSLKEPALVVMVDQEGGRVQRFRQGFTLLPPMASLGELYDQQGEEIELFYAEQVGAILAYELGNVGVYPSS